MTEDFASFATRRISTLTKIFGYLKGIVSHKNTQYYKLYLCFNLSVYISRDFSLPLSIEMHGGHFFPGHPYIIVESTTKPKIIYLFCSFVNQLNRIRKLKLLDYNWIIISISKYMYILCHHAVITTYMTN